jgi:hypothetical protein
MKNLEKTHEYLKNKQKLLLQLWQTKKRKIIEELANEIEKGIDILIWVGKEISRKKKIIRCSIKGLEWKKKLEKSFVSTSKSEGLWYHKHILEE